MTARPTKPLMLLLCVASTPASGIEGSDSDWVWRSATEPAGPPVFWADLPDTGGSVLTLSSGRALVSLGFTVSLLGSTVSAITVTEDGLVIPATGSGPGTYGSSTCIGDGSTTGAAIAPLWGNWDTAISGEIWTKTWVDGIIIEWREMQSSTSETSSVDFAVMIRSNGEMAFAYSDTSTGLTASSLGNGAAIGLQYDSGSGIAISCNEAVLESGGDAIAIAPLGTRFLAGEHGADELTSTWILGESTNDRFGSTLAGLGDLDGDGLDEFSVGAPLRDDGGSSAGAVYVFGGESSESGSVSTGDAWVRIIGSQSGDQAGSSMDGGMDMDGDGLDDLIIGIPYEDTNASNAGAATVFGGSTLLAETTLEIDDADTMFWGESGNDYAGDAVAWAGDVDGDGYADLLVGAPGEDTGGSSAGMVYLVLGSSSPVDSDLGSADAAFYGEADSDMAGSSLVGLGDIDGDGLDDFAIGAHGQDDGASDAGATYLVFGEARPSGTVGLASEARALGGSSNEAAGYALGRTGDLDGDGTDDLLVGAPLADSMDGVFYAVSGADFPTDLTDAWGSAVGGSAHRLGASLAGLDNGEEILIAAGAYGDSSDATMGGSINLFHPDDIAGTELSSESDAWGRIIGSDSTGYLGSAMAIGDFDGDGLDDLLAGAYGMDGADTTSGAVALIPGTTTWPDVDGDGFVSTDWGGLDCDDEDPSIGPSNADVCDGIDNDCEGSIDTGFADTDEDGITDCIDTEECDGLDNDGDGSIDEGMLDSDSDGLCDALDSEECDGLDNDGDGLVDEDFPDTDGDGIADCLDAEECDGLDNDGDGTVDEGYPDTDGDGFADCIDSEGCDGLDNDGDGLVDEDFPDTDGDGTADCMDDETCDGIDNDGDGTVDEDLNDVDGDGICDEMDREDCDGLDNDGDGAIDEDFEDADGDGLADCQDGEDCDGLDNDGDGFVDEGYQDTDGDGVADCVEVEECDGLDNDGDGLIDEIFPDSDFDGIADCSDIEECDGIDNDGDGSIDEEWPDVDEDGASDCIDVETCDGIDNDGDALIDEGFSDVDEDGVADCVDTLNLEENDFDGSIDAGGCSVVDERRVPSPLFLGLFFALGIARRTQQRR